MYYQISSKTIKSFSPLFTLCSRNKEQINVIVFANEIREFYFERFKDVIDFNVESDKNDFQISANKGKLTQILDNLILNSEYWLKEKARTDKNFSPTITLEVRNPF